MPEPEEFLAALRASFGGAEAVYTEGSCWQLFKILKLLYPQANPYYDAIEGHVYAEIYGYLYDIRGFHGHISDYQSRSYINDLEIIPHVDLTEDELESWIYN